MRLLQVSQWLLLARCHWAICFILSTVARCHNRSMEHRPCPGKMWGLAGTWLSISPWLAQVLPNPRPVFRSRDLYCPIRDKYKLGTRQSPGPGSSSSADTLSLQLARNTRTLGLFYPGDGWCGRRRRNSPTTAYLAREPHTRSKAWMSSCTGDRILLNGGWRLSWYWFKTEVQIWLSASPSLSILLPLKNKPWWIIVLRNNFDHVRTRWI